jgi:translation initiation factor eIF-2B subunit alpha
MLTRRLCLCMCSAYPYLTPEFYFACAADAIVREFHDALARSPDMAVAVAAIRALTSVVKNSSAQTMMGLEKELKDAAASLERCHETAISLKAGCELFLRYTTRTSALEMENFADAKKRIIEVWHR